MTEYLWEFELDDGTLKMVSGEVMWEIEKFYWDDVYSGHIPSTQFASEKRKYEKGMTTEFMYNFTFTKYPHEIGNGGFVGQ